MLDKMRYLSNLMRTIKNDFTLCCNFKLFHNLFSGTQFPLEAQPIHFKSDYGTMDEALTQDDGVAVLVALFQVRFLLKRFGQSKFKVSCL